MTDIDIEHTPTPKQEFLDDGTSFDVLVRYVDTAGRPAFLGVEVKLSESPSRRPETRRPRYLELTARGPWSADPEVLRQPPIGQLWRDHLLVEAARHHPERYGEVGRFVLLHHPEDPVWTDAAQRYRATLSDPGAFLELTLDQVIDAIWDAAEHEQDWQWLQAFAVRYLDLHRSGWGASSMAH